jgi:hypothetical protein
MQSQDKPRCIYQVPAYGSKDGDYYQCRRAAEEGREYCRQHAKKVAKEAEREIIPEVPDSKLPKS